MFDYDSYQAGQRWGDTGNVVAAAAARRDRDGAIAEWQAYARQLESQLSLAKLNLVRARAGEAANGAVLRELRQHVVEMAPRDPLVQPGVVLTKIRDKIREDVENQGYRVVNPETLDIAAR